MVIFSRAVALAALSCSVLSAHAVVAPQRVNGTTPLRTSIQTDPPLVVTAESAPAPSAAPADPVVPARSEALVQPFQRAARQPFSIGWDTSAQVLRTMAAGRSRPYPGEPVAAARAFVDEALPFLGPEANPDRLDAGTVRRTAFGPQVRFRQTVNGVPVLGQEITVSMTDAGEVIMAENTTGPVAAVNTRPTVSALAAAGRAKGRIIDPPELFVDASNDEARLVWRVSVERDGLRFIRATIDAHTGEWLGSHSLIQHATGAGMVYTENPLMTPQLVSRDFNHLDGTGYLTGLYNKTYMFGESNGNLTPSQPVRNLDLAYNFNAGTSEQTQAQTYWGITQSHEYFKNTFNFTGRDHQLPAFVRIEGMANAFFTSSTSWGGFSTPNGFMGFGRGSVDSNPTRDFALDTDVLVHEYTHAVVNKQNNAFAEEVYENGDRGGISEGNADFYAGVIVGNSRVGEYAAQAYGLNEVRDLAGRNHYPEEVQMKMNFWTGSEWAVYQDYAEEHVTGEIWGPALWDLRLVIGPQKAEQIIFRGVTLLSGTSLFQSAMAALITADNQLYGGANAASIRQVFNGRGIEESVYPIKYLTSDTFYQTAGSSKFRVGDVYQDSLGFFRDDDEEYFEGRQLFPSFVVDRYYLLQGYTADSTIKAVSLEVRDAGDAFVRAVIFSVSSMLGYNSIGNPATFGYVGAVFGFPSSTFTEDRTGLKLFLKSFTETPGVVQSQYFSLTPKATAPSGTMGRATQIIHPRTTPIFESAPFGDTDDSKATDLRDALLVIRSLNGIGTLTTEQKKRSDVAQPVNGEPDMADARAILQIGAGLR